MGVLLMFHFVFATTHERWSGLTDYCHYTT